jgi:hypothetical protein
MFAITPRILIPVLPINDAMYYPLLECQTMLTPQRIDAKNMKQATTVTKTFP